MSNRDPYSDSRTTECKRGRRDALPPRMARLSESFNSELPNIRLLRVYGHSRWVLLSAENQLGGAARNHVGRRVCPWSRNDLWHHGGVRHA